MAALANNVAAHKLHAATASVTYLLIDGDKDLTAEAAGGGQPCRRLRVGTGGDLRVQYADGAIDTIPALIAGETIDVIVVKIVQAGSTAAKVTAFF